MFNTLKIFSFCFFVLNLSIQAQDSVEYTGVDETFKMARQEIFLGDREKGIELLKNVLERSPGYVDVRIFLARTFAWNNHYDSARIQLAIVLSAEPRMEDALSALADVDMWDDRYEDALLTVNKALKYFPASADLLLRKARILNSLDRLDEALVSLDKLLTAHPGNDPAMRLREEIKSTRMKYTAGILYGVDIFSRTFDPSQYMAVEVSRSNSWGSATLRLNVASRFSEQGVQPEIEIYPKIAKGVYGYLNYGFSNSSLFSKHRIGAELYSKLPLSLEASAGLRSLYFPSGNTVTIYTGSLGWYFGNCWLSYRPYITPDRAGTSFSSLVLFRRYFSDADSYVGFNLGFGFSPDERRIQSGSGFTSDGIFVLRSQNVSVFLQKKFSRNFILSANYSLVHQELSFDLDRYVWINGLAVGVKRKF